MNNPEAPKSKKSEGGKAGISRRGFLRLAGEAALAAGVGLAASATENSSEAQSLNVTHEVKKLPDISRYEKQFYAEIDVFYKTYAEGFRAFLRKGATGENILPVQATYKRQGESIQHLRDAFKKYVEAIRVLRSGEKIESGGELIGMYDRCVLEVNILLRQDKEIKIMSDISAGASLKRMEAALKNLDPELFLTVHRKK